MPAPGRGAAPLARSESLKRGFVFAVGMLAGKRRQPKCLLVGLLGVGEVLLGRGAGDGECPACLAAVPIWEVALGMLGGTSERQGFGKETFIDIYSGF